MNISEARNQTIVFILLSIAMVVMLFEPGRAGALSGTVLNQGLVVDVEDLVQVPASAAEAPLAKINMLVESPDGSGRLFVIDLRGELYVLDEGSISIFMDMAIERPLKTSPGIGTGFISIAFHPEFGSNGLFYTVHTEDVGAIPVNLAPAIPVTYVMQVVLTEWDASDPAANSFAGGSRELMRIASMHRFHNVGEIAFNPNALPGDEDYGLLYIAGGDYSAGAGEKDGKPAQPDQVQRLDTPYGTIMRIDPLGGPFDRNSITYNYGIPVSNPYAADTDPNTLGEIFAHGFRNAHRLAWDTGGSGSILVSDIGQANIEEVNLLQAGANYGWPLREGSYALDVLSSPGVVFPLPVGDELLGYNYPVLQYDHEEGDAIAGGFVYRGPIDSDLQGKFVFGDIVTGRMFYADLDEMLAADDGDSSTMAQIFELNLVHENVPKTLLEITGTSRADLRFGTDLVGNIYLTTKSDGYIRRLLPRPIPGNSDPVSITAPVISGVAQVGGALITTEGTWDDPDGDSLAFTYRWFANGDEIQGADTDTFSITVDQAHQSLSVEVTANDGNGGSASATSSATAVTNANPTSLVLPVISGSDRVGGTVTVTNGLWSDNDDDALIYFYQWRADSVEIATATSSTYSIAADDAHKILTVEVIAGDGFGGARSAISSGFQVVNSAPTNTALPTISGQSEVGETLSADVGEWLDIDEDTLDISVQWLADGVDIPNADSMQYLLSKADVGSLVAVRITVDDGHGGMASATSIDSGSVASAPTVASDDSDEKAPGVTAFDPLLLLVFVAMIGVFNLARRLKTANNRQGTN